MTNSNKLDLRQQTNDIISILEENLATKEIKDHQISLYDIIISYALIKKEIKEISSKFNSVVRSFKIKEFNLLNNEVLFYTDSFCGATYEFYIKKENDEILISKVIEGNKKFFITNLREFSKANELADTFYNSLPMINNLFEKLDKFHGFYDNVDIKDVSNTFIVKLENSTVGISIVINDIVIEILKLDIFNDEEKYYYMYSSSKFIYFIKGEEKSLIDNMYFSIEIIPNIIINYRNKTNRLYLS